MYDIYLRNPVEKRLFLKYSDYFCLKNINNDQNPCRRWSVAVDEIHVVQSKKSCRIKELNKF